MLKLLCIFEWVNKEYERMYGKRLDIRFGGSAESSVGLGVDIRALRTSISSIKVSPCNIWDM